MADNRGDIAIETAEAISGLIDVEIGIANADAKDSFVSGLRRANLIIATFIAASRVQQGPKRGRPRNPKSEP